MESQDSRGDRGGRSLRWRVSMLVAGLLAAGYGTALILWPQVLIWSVAAVFLIFLVFDTTLSEELLILLVLKDENNDEVNMEQRNRNATQED